MQFNILGSSIHSSSHVPVRPWFLCRPRRSLLKLFSVIFGDLRPCYPWVFDQFLVARNKNVRNSFCQNPLYAVLNFRLNWILIPHYLFGQKKFLNIGFLFIVHTVISLAAVGCDHCMRQQFFGLGKLQLGPGRPRFGSRKLQPNWFPPRKWNCSSIELTRMLWLPHQH